MNDESTTSRTSLCLAIDAPTAADAESWVPSLVPFVGTLKIGLELFTREGPAVVAWAQPYGLDLFLDLKLHDIPETIDRAIGAIAALGVRYTTVHAQGGPRMLERAVLRAEKENPRLVVLAVTVLTSLEPTELQAIGFTEVSASAHVQRLARLAHSVGIGGLVCSGADVPELRSAFPAMTLVTPGVRPVGAAADDQRRTCTARQAIAAGSDLLVVGRPLRDAVDSATAARELLDEIAAGFRDRKTS